MSRRRRIARKHSRFTTSDPRQLTAGSVRTIRRGALADISRGSRNSSSMGFSVNIFTRKELSVMAAEKDIAATWNRIVRNFAALLQRKAREISRPTYDTGLFSSSWTAAARGSGVKLRVILENLTPYAGHVRRKRGAPKVVDKVRGMVTSETERFLDDATRGQIAASVKDRILAELAKDKP